MASKYQWTYAAMGVDRPYSQEQVEDIERRERLHEVSDDAVERFSGFVAVKGKVEPGTPSRGGARALLILMSN